MPPGRAIFLAGRASNLTPRRPRRRIFLTRHRGTPNTDRGFQTFFHTENRLTMKVLFWYCKTFSWHPAAKALPGASDSEGGQAVDALVAMVHVEPLDVAADQHTEAAMTKNTKWLAKKWGTKTIVLHAFPHLSQEKATPEAAKLILDRVRVRLEKSGHAVKKTPHGYFLDIGLHAPGNPLASVYKVF